MSNGLIGLLGFLGEVADAGKVKDEGHDEEVGSDEAEEEDGKTVGACGRGISHNPSWGLRMPYNTC